MSDSLGQETIISAVKINGEIWQIDHFEARSALKPDRKGSEMHTLPCLLMS